MPYRSSVPSHYLDQFYLIVNWTLEKNSIISIQQNAFDIVVFQNVGHFFKGRWVKYSRINEANIMTVVPIAPAWPGHQQPYYYLWTSEMTHRQDWYAILLRLYKMLNSCYGSWWMIIIGSAYRYQLVVKPYKWWHVIDFANWEINQNHLAWFIVRFGNSTYVPIMDM